MWFVAHSSWLMAKGGRPCPQGNEIQCIHNEIPCQSRFSMKLHETRVGSLPIEVRCSVHVKRSSDLLIWQVSLPAGTYAWFSRWAGDSAQNMRLIENFQKGKIRKIGARCQNTSHEIAKRPRRKKWFVGVLASNVSLGGKSGMSKVGLQIISNLK